MASAWRSSMTATNMIAIIRGCADGGDGCAGNQQIADRAE